MTNNCSRCKGKGFFRQDAGVLHYGVPGLCWSCNGAGTRSAQLSIKAKMISDKEAASAKFLDEQKVHALALYDARELGYINERKFQRRFASVLLELRSAGISDEQFKAHVVTDEVAVKLATEAMNK